LDERDFYLDRKENQDFEGIKTRHNNLYKNNFSKKPDFYRRTRL
jgi:hypothetical protein